MDLAKCEVKDTGRSVLAIFHPLAEKPDALRVTISAGADGQALTFAYDADPSLAVDSIRLLDDAFGILAGENGYLAIPCREGLLIPADSGIAFSHSFDTYAYEGCHMAMVGVVKNGAAALVTWDDPYTRADVRSVLPKDAGGKQTLSLSMTLRKSAKACTVRFLGKGDYVTIAKAYRDIAKTKGWLVTWDQKLKENPNRAKLFGAINFKLWSALSRRMNEDSTKEERATVNWTFDEAAQIAEHLKNDLKLDKVHFLMGGWIKRGYDNQHPDILPAAPECGGDAKFADASRRILACGYMFGLHDNYQDMYKDSPSWDESFIQKQPDGKLVRGGKWAGGYAYITCSQKAVELAQRPQNLPAVKKLTNADSYFIDTTYAAGLQECFDPKHPLARADDMKWKQAISDYARSVFGTFGSECGREWAIPHADYFEGLTGVSGTYYHQLKPQTLGATVIPLFELVYRDCIAMYGKYGYDINNSAEYVLHHISIGRTLNYHTIPPHLYWKEAAAESIQMQPAVASFEQTGPRQFRIAYDWTVKKGIAEDWAIFVHFTDARGQIKFQGDHRPGSPVSKWQPGTLRQGPFTVTIPQGLSGTFDIRIGMHQPDKNTRAQLLGPKDRERRCLLGQINVTGEKIEFIKPAAEQPTTPGSDPAMFVRADNGWAEGMHPTDRFVKNTAEILSPLNEITSRMQMTDFRFLTPDRKVRLSVFGQGNEAVRVIVNGSESDYAADSEYPGKAVLPPNGFLIESKTFVAFCAKSWNGLTYETPTCFTVRDLQGGSLRTSTNFRIFHAFGDTRINTASPNPQRIMDIPRETALMPVDIRRPRGSF
jgi:hypothetical protein